MRLVDADFANIFLNIEACEQIKRMQTVDAVPVVRCKDCRMATKDIMIDGWYHCENNLMTHRPDCFCSYGERKE